MKQTEGTETANVSFDLGAATMNYGNNATYFQWGRKDPMPPSTGLANKNKPIYGTYTALSNIYTTDIAATIRTPYYFNSDNGNPSLELWNVGNTSTTVNIDPVVKSIYDPSPAGFHLPPSGAFDGWDENNRYYWNYDTSGLKGMYVYQLAPNTGTIIFFPAFGYYYNGHSAIGYYWSAGASSASIGRHLYFSSGGVRPQDKDSRSYGYTVRSVSE